MRLIRVLPRPASAALGCLLAWAVMAGPAGANTIDVALNVSYMDMMDPLSGGTWELVAKSHATASAGIHSLNLRLTNVATIMNAAPIGVVNGGDPAGFDFFSIAGFDDHTNVLIAQRTLPSGTLEQSVFYGVGTLTDGEPGDIGPMFMTLTNVMNAPWAITPMTPDVFDVPGWETAATFLTGTFDPGVTPGFYTGDDSTGSIYTAVGSSTMIGPLMPVSPLTSTIVRTNFVSPADADYNNDGFVNAADYTVWRNTVGSTTVFDADGSGPGGVPDGMIDRFDYDFWKAHYGETVPGAGAGAVAGDLDVPEPGSATLLALGLALLIPPRRGRFSGRAGRENCNP